MRVSPNGSLTENRSRPLGRSVQGMPSLPDATSVPRTENPTASITRPVTAGPRFSTCPAMTSVLPSTLWKTPESTRAGPGDTPAAPAAGAATTPMTQT
ncbi:MAG: hypothetical protein ACRDFT_10255, partial [bacterium]